LIAEIIPDAYDAEGKRTYRPDLRLKSGFRPTFPIGKFLSQPLKTQCVSFREMRKFLSKCSYVSDEEQFGMEDYWQSPEDFEISKKGDCDDFALWAWRQVLGMGFPARFVIGPALRYGQTHAWVTFEKDGKNFILEALNWVLGESMPRLSAIRYHPRTSVEWNGEKIIYFVHQKRTFNPTLGQAASLLGEWLWFYLKFCTRFIWLFLVRLPTLLFRKWIFGRPPSTDHKEKSSLLP
jgi:hypothetical protein